MSHRIRAICFAGLVLALSACGQQAVRGAADRPMSTGNIPTPHPREAPPFAASDEWANQGQTIIAAKARATEFPIVNKGAYAYQSEPIDIGDDGTYVLRFQVSADYSLATGFGLVIPRDAVFTIHPQAPFTLRQNADGTQILEIPVRVVGNPSPYPAFTAWMS